VSYPTPLAAITALVDARNAGDIETALTAYSPDITIIPQPGTVLTGLDGARAALEGFIGMKPTFTVLSREVLESETTALHYSKWHFVGTAPDGSTLDVTGASTDVFEKRDGGWLVTIDNPFGAGILDLN
jgi:uncharacterized protein (TIGR02246 family)